MFTYSVYRTNNHWWVADMQDPEGYTALHSTLPGLHTQCMALLLRANVDPTFLNFHCNAAISDAARSGVYQ